MKKSLTILAGVFLFMSLLTSMTRAQNPNLHIYICFGQSNMEGMGAIKAEDKIVDERFLVFQPFSWGSYEKESWRTAKPPLVNQYSKLSVADYFGRTLVENLPDSIMVGVIPVAIGGCDIRLFDKDIYEDYDSTYLESWFLDKVGYYNGNPYKYLMDLAKLAQKDGVIKGLILHQGETNTGDKKWPSYVKKIYNDMLQELSLSADSVPIIAGEVGHEDQDGLCETMNKIINRLPDTIPTAYTVTSSGCTLQSDFVHFDTEGVRLLGKRYGEKMLEILGEEVSSAVNSIADINNQLVVYPNPIEKSGHINYVTNKDNACIKIESSEGEVITFQLSDKSGDISLDEHGVSLPGIYSAKLIASERVLSKVEFYIVNKKGDK